MATKKTATKNTVTKKRKYAKATVPAKLAGPREAEITGELRYMIEAHQLKINVCREALSAPLLAEMQQKFNATLARTLRNDPQFVKLSDEWQSLIDAAIAKHCPNGYKVQALNPTTGVMTFVPASDSR